MDAQVAHVAHKIGPYQLHALVEQAIAQFMPDLAEERRLARADGRYFTVEAQQDSYDGTAAVHGTLDLADAHDLETAVADLAAQLKHLGSEDSLDVRRALAVGELARCQPTLDLNPMSVEPVETTRTQRQVVLYVHLTDAALTGAAGTARLERGNGQVTAGQVRDWCGTAGKITVKPVIDLETHDPVDSPGGAGPARRDRHPPRPHLRLPLVHQTSQTLRQGPLDPACAWRTDLSVQSRRRSVAGTTGSRPTARGPTARSSPAPTCGRPSTATNTSATPRHARRVLRPAPATRLTTPPHTPPTGGAIACPGDRVRPRQARPTYLAALPNLMGFRGSSLALLAPQPPGCARTRSTHLARDGRVKGTRPPGGTVPDSEGQNDDLKAKMREALDRKRAHDHPDDTAGHQAKAHGPEVAGGAAPKVHRRKAGGGGS